MIFNYDGSEILLDQKRLVGVVENISIDGKIIMDSSKAEGASKTEKVLSGYDDITISVSLLLVPDENMSIDTQIETLQTEFERSQQGIPVVHSIEQDYINAIGVYEVYWTSLSFSYAKDSLVGADLAFVEVATQRRITGISTDTPEPAAPAYSIEESPEHREALNNYSRGTPRD